MKKILRPYQVSAVRYLRKNSGGALFMEMRLGKTLATIRALGQLLPRPNAQVLVVAPYSALNGWIEHLIEEDIDYIELFGTRKQRFEKLGITEQGITYYLLNKEGFLVLPEIAHVPWNAMVLDESTFIKSPASKKKCKVSYFFTQNFRQVPIRIILTGTPAPESYLDYFNQLFFVNPDILHCQNYWEFRLKHFALYGPYEWKIRPKSAVWLSRVLAEHCFTLKRKDVDLAGKKIYEQRFTQLSPAMYKIYKKLVDEFILEWNNTRIKTKFAGVKYSLLRQFCGGFIEKKIASKHKITEIQHLLEGELAGQQIVVWCQFIHELKYLQNMVKNSRYICGEVSPSDRERIRKDFQAGKIQYLFVQPETWKFGVTLTAAQTMIYYSTPEGYLTRSQTEDRTLDLSKNNSVLIVDVVTEKTIERSIQRGLRGKETQVQIMERMVYELQNNVDG